MNLSTYNLESTEYRHLITEIMFNISSSRSLSFDLLMLKFNTDTPEALTVSRTERILKSLKKKGFIQYLVTSEQCKEGSEEAEYLYNRFPDVTERVEAASAPFFIIKL